MYKKAKINTIFEQHKKSMNECAAVWTTAITDPKMLLLKYLFLKRIMPSCVREKSCFLTLYLNVVYKDLDFISIFTGSTRTNDHFNRYVLSTLLLF
jgi:hypothetical protein